MARLLARLRRWPRLPLLLLAGMLVIGLWIETTVAGVPRWAPKLPVALLIAIAGLRSRGGRRGPPR